MLIRIQFFTLMRIRTGYCSSSKWCKSGTTGVQTLQGSILNLHASIVSVHCPPLLHVEPLKLLNFDFNADSDQAVHCNADPDPASKNNADLDPQPWFLPSTIWQNLYKWDSVPLKVSHSLILYSTETIKDGLWLLFYLFLMLCPTHSKPCSS
jgi:hypothetical protein